MAAPYSLLAHDFHRCGLRSSLRPSECLGQAAQRVLASRDMRERMHAAGAEPIDEGPVQLASRIRADHGKWGAVVKAANVRVD